MTNKQTPDKNANKVKVGNADETVDHAAETDGAERKGPEPVVRPGGDGRVANRADDRNDGAPDAPMPPVDGSRK